MAQILSEPVTQNKQDLELELQAIRKFNNTISNSSNLTFNECVLESAIACFGLGPPKKRKLIALYLHRPNSNTFWLKEQESRIQPLQKSYNIGWFLENQAQVDALESVLENNYIYMPSGALKTPKSALLFIYYKCSIPVTYFYHLDKIDTNVFGCSLIKDIFSLFEDENCDEVKLAAAVEENQEKLAPLMIMSTVDVELSSKEFQQRMGNLLGDRDYDRFDFNQHEHLLDAICYALYGPQKDDCYSDKEQEVASVMREQIASISSEFSEHKDQVEISTIYVCMEPLTRVKTDRAKTFIKQQVNYNPVTDIDMKPIFVLRRCRQSVKPCRVFIDHIGRAYQNWEQFLTKNKYDKCFMVLPRDGRYQFDKWGRVLLECIESPACDVQAKVLKIADGVTLAGTLVSIGIFGAAAIPAITMAPIVLGVGAILGVGTAIYTGGRSIHTIVDRARHKEALHFKNADARSAYLNLATSTMGFVGAGTTLIVNRLITQGVSLGQGARITINTINATNIGTSGVTVGNSVYDVFDNWVNKNQKPSTLTVLQLSSSILFFGHAVYNFRGAGTMIDETQKSLLNDHMESLNSNNQRKAFNNVLKETIRQSGSETKGQAEVISLLRTVENKAELFASLNKHKTAMNKNGIKVAADGGQIKLNGVAVDINEFARVSKSQGDSFFNSIPTCEGVLPTDSESFNIMQIVGDIFNDVRRIDLQQVAPVVLKCYESDVQEIVLAVLKLVLDQIDFREQFLRLFPSVRFDGVMLTLLLNFFRREAQDLLKSYEVWMTTRDPEKWKPIYDRIIVNALKSTDIILLITEEVIRTCFMNGRIGEAFLNRILDYFRAWYCKEAHEKIVTEEQVEQQRVHSALAPTMGEHCNVCGGLYFAPKKK